MLGAFIFIIVRACTGQQGGAGTTPGAPPPYGGRGSDGYGPGPGAPPPGYPPSGPSCAPQYPPSSSSSSGPGGMGFWSGLGIGGLLGNMMRGGGGYNRGFGGTTPHTTPTLSFPAGLFLCWMLLQFLFRFHFVYVSSSHVARARRRVSTAFWGRDIPQRRRRLWGRRLRRRGRIPHGVR